ncbi:hypothetical protein D6T64_02025 [Cryobacterium melibiosiphilum]|uniref:Alpha/beta hydrolase fold-3 domain-containing protein n=1 Tax=Cryobacterium melibiosiphilum TaxID=995039 RepID=A0A3A5MMG5_9MICO|nr:alpha/beta hydrolase fold domain-containing protein [Cryobacterium melibiosiphilum]RJT91297.1 hypothetical protein D6T64_02025 [Cryobacterium melibiosiphilum]
MKPVNSIDSMIQGPHGLIPVRRYSPSLGMSPVSFAPIVWIHGGGFFKGSLDQPESHDVARSLAAAGFQVVTVDYRLDYLKISTIFEWFLAGARRSTIRSRSTMSSQWYGQFSARLPTG